jgi:hypothetical protein
MNALLRRRLARLEQAISPAETVHVWAGTETLADTIARWFPKGAPDGVRVLAYRWAIANQAEAYSRR